MEICDYKNDVLQELTLNEVIKLGDLYKKHLNIAPHIYSFIQTGIRWNTSQSLENYYNFFKLQSNWEVDGTIIAIAHFPWKILMLFTLDQTKNGEELLRNALIKTNRFDYHRDKIVYYGIINPHLSLVEAASNSLHLTKIKHEDTNLWHLKPENFRKSLSLPTEYKLSSLKIDDASVINHHWPHSEPGSETYIRLLIERNLTFGVYTHNTLIAWVLETPLGTIGLLHVLDSHRRKGIARFLLNTLAECLLNDRGLHPCGVVLTENDASQALFAECGFDKALYCVCLTYKKQL